jgi:hypothetical protein
LIALHCTSALSQTITNKDAPPANPRTNALSEISDVDKSKAMRILAHGDLLQVRYFRAAQVYFQGSAEQLGLDAQELQDFVNLKQKNIFTGYEMKSLPKDAQFTVDGLDFKVLGVDMNEWAGISVRVWTVGDDYPVAYHLKLSIVKLGGGKHGYEDELLGVSSRQKIRDTRLLKDAITGMMETAATEIMKLQGKL